MYPISRLLVKMDSSFRSMKTLDKDRDSIKNLSKLFASIPFGQLHNSDNETNDSRSNILKFGHRTFAHR